MKNKFVFKLEVADIIPRCNNCDRDSYVVLKGSNGKTYKLMTGDSFVLEHITEIR